MWMAWLRVGMPVPMLVGLGSLIALILVAAYTLVARGRDAA